MKGPYKHFLNNPTRVRLATNFVSLATIQGANYLIPLLILPYIVRIIGPDKFGLLTYAQTFVYYFTILINYSFDYTATREISLNRDNKERLTHIYSSIFYCKLILLLISTLIFIFCVGFIDQFNKNLEIYLVTYLINVGFVFFPSWLFQGLEKLSITAAFNLITKVIFAVLVILFVTESGDFWVYTLSLSIGQILVGVAAFFYAQVYFNVRILRVSIIELLKVFKSGSPVFLSNVVISLYTTTNLVILGFFTSESEYGYFSAALKIESVVYMMIILPLGMTLFPHVATKMEQSKLEGIQTLIKYMKWVSLITFILGVFTFLYAGELVLLLFGDSFVDGALYLRVMAFMPLFSALTNLILVQGLLNLKEDKLFLRITIAVLLFSLALNVILVPTLHALGTSIIQLVAEIFTVILSGVLLYRKWQILLSV